MNLSRLKKQLKTQLNILDGNTALVVNFVNTKDGISINEKVQFWDASIIKVPISCEYLSQVSQGKIDFDTRTSIKPENEVEGSVILKLLNKDNVFTYMDLVILMLDISDNSATNEVLPKCARLCYDYSVS